MKQTFVLKLNLKQLVLHQIKAHLLDQKKTNVKLIQRIQVKLSASRKVMKYQQAIVILKYKYIDIYNKWDYH